MSGRRVRAKPARRGHVMAGLALWVVETARALGVDLSDVLDEAALEPMVLAAADAYVPVEVHERLWAEAARRTDRLDLGIHAAERLVPGLTGAVEYALRNCATVRDAAETWVRLAGAVSDCISARLVATRGAVRLTWLLNRPDSAGARQWTEFALARTVCLMRDALAEPRLAPSEVHFRHAPFGSEHRARAFFGAPVRYAQAETALHFSASLLDRPLLMVDSTARVLLQGRAEQLLERRADDRPIVEAVEQALAALLREPGADLRLEQVAERLGLGKRTVQERLSRERTSFRALVAAARRRAAEGWFADPGLTIAEVARRCGYADAAAFRKARRRWMSPRTRQSGTTTRSF